MLEILASSSLRSASSQLLAMLSELIPVNTLFVAVNDDTTNQIIKVHNRSEVLITEGAFPFHETYCSHVCQHDDNVLIIPDTSAHEWTARMSLTAAIGKTAFVGVPIILRDGRRVGTVCAMDRNVSTFTEQEIDWLQTGASSLANVIMLENDVYLDRATGAFTRRYLEDMFYRWSRDGVTIAAFVVGLNKIKLFTNVEGFQSGDDVLRAVAERLRAAIRPSDVLARLGYEEFAVLVGGIDSNEALAAYAEKVVACFRQPLLDGHRRFTATPRVGIAVYPYGGLYFNDLMRNAFLAMYAVPQSGNQPPRFFHPRDEMAVHSRLQLEHQMYTAMECDEFDVQYQPKFGVQDGIVHSVEALMRWKTGDGQFISPETFIPVAEECGLIQTLGRWVLTKACQQNKAWQDLGYPPVVVSVNISPKQFEFGNMYQTIVEVLQETGLQPEWLGIEITEGLLMRNSADIAKELKQIRNLGVKIAIDDFGKGYSSLSYLRLFEPSHLKIDKLFIQQMLEDAGYRSIVSATINLAHNLNMKVIAEGVETQEQYQWLAAQGCDLIQGYLLSKPLVSSDLEELFKSGCA